MELEPDPGSITIQFIIIAILILLNAFFASSEMAIVSLNKNKIKRLSDEGNKKAQLLLKLIEEPTNFLSTIQVGITLAGFFSSASAATGISDDFALFLKQFNLLYSEQIALIVITILLSYITLVFGELFPKRVALKKSEAIAMFAVRPIVFISKITLPFVKLLSLSTNILVKIARLDKQGLDEIITEEEIRSLVEVGQEQGIINETEKEMINNIFKLDDRLAHEIMTPRIEVCLINIEQPLNEYLDELIQEGYSRIPVYEGNIDNIIGILYMKDLLIEARKYGFNNIDIRSIMKSAYLVPETKNIDELLRELQAVKTHMAILVDEYGGFSGIVTIEDIIEEVMGDIEDEHDKDEPEIYKINNHIYIVDGRISLYDFNDYFHTEIKSKDYDTLSGFLIDFVGHIPIGPQEEKIEYENLSFEIEEVNEKRIEKIKVYIHNKDEIE